MEVRFAKNLRGFRKEVNLTQKQLADKLNVSQSAVARWESGDDKPSYEILGDICKLFKVSADELLGFDNF